MWDCTVCDKSLAECTCGEPSMNIDIPYNPKTTLCDCGHTTDSVYILDTKKLTNLSRIKPTTTVCTNCAYIVLDKDHSEHKAVASIIRNNLKR